METGLFLDLRERHKLVWKKGGKFEISVGDIVIVYEDKQPRSNWRLGKIEKVIHGKDGNIRGASLRVITTERRHSLIERPLQRLFPLELAIHDTSGQDESRSRPEHNSTEEAYDRPDGLDRPVRLDRPRRDAAVNADLIRRLSQFLVIDHC